MYKMTSLLFLLFTIPLVVSHISGSNEPGTWDVENCRSSLLPGQYICPDPNRTSIDLTTQEYQGCTKENTAEVFCLAAPKMNCLDGNGSQFSKLLPCRWTNGYKLDTALLLSVFLGMFGADRFYLGYPAIGIAKMCTLGFLLVGQFVDIVLIATQTVGPADGSHYIIPYYGARVTVIRLDNETFIEPNKDWLIS